MHDLLPCPTGSDHIPCETAFAFRPFVHLSAVAAGPCSDPAGSRDNETIYCYWLVRDTLQYDLMSYAKVNRIKIPIIIPRLCFASHLELQILNIKNGAATVEWTRTTGSDTTPFVIRLLTYQTRNNQKVVEAAQLQTVGIPNPSGKVTFEPLQSG